MNAPKHLRKETREWWGDVSNRYELEPHHLRLLTLAAEAWDRGQQARETINKTGAFFTTRTGMVKAHPAIAVERDSRIAFARLIRELALDVEPPTEMRRPPRIGGE